MRQLIKPLSKQEAVDVLEQTSHRINEMLLFAKKGVRKGEKQRFIRQLRSLTHFQEILKVHIPKM